MFLGFLIAFWATPHMTVGHLYFALMITGYVLFAVGLEERDLVATLGEPYVEYRKRVPMMLPFTQRRSRQRFSGPCPDRLTRGARPDTAQL